MTTQTTQTSRRVSEELVLNTRLRHLTDGPDRMHQPRKAERHDNRQDQKKEVHARSRGREGRAGHPG